MLFTNNEMLNDIKDILKDANNLDLDVAYRNGCKSILIDISIYLNNIEPEMLELEQDIYFTNHKDNNE